MNEITFVTKNEHGNFGIVHSIEPKKDRIIFADHRLAIVHEEPVLGHRFGEPFLNYEERKNVAASVCVKFIASIS